MRPCQRYLGNCSTPLYKFEHLEVFLFGFSHYIKKNSINSWYSRIW